MLDEATAAIDLQTHERIQEFLKYRFGSITTLVIAHRLDTVMECDRVMVLEQGKTLEFASPKVLLENSNSEFSKLARHLGHIKNLTKYD
jgi:ABC-type multidrug transport system fused ATPase/permease subunit